jgi:hypothetical protein
VVVIWKVIVEAEAVAGMVFVICAVLVVRPVGHTSTKVVLMIVVTFSSPLLGAGAETTGRSVVLVTGAGVVSAAEETGTVTA